MSIHGTNPRELIPRNDFANTNMIFLCVSVYFLFLTTCSGELGPCANDWLPPQGVLRKGQLTA